MHYFKEMTSYGAGISQPRRLLLLLLLLLLLIPPLLQPLSQLVILSFLFNQQFFPVALCFRLDCRSHTETK